MSSKAHPNHANKVAAKQESSKPTVQHTAAVAEHTHRAAIVQRAKFNPQSLTPREVLELQRTIGNQAVQRMLGQASIQAKLTVSSPGDIYEQEADRVSEHVMRMPEKRLQRACKCGGACSECQAGPPAQVHRLVQTKGVQTNGGGASAPAPIVDQVLRTPGQPLDADMRAFMEPRFGHDFSGVRVHTDSDAGSSAESVGARAFTVGSHVVFGAGEYRPGTADGQRLLAHELTHVAQQGTGSPFHGSVVQRDDKAKAPTPTPTPAPNTAAGGPKLDFQPAKNPPPCACIVFMHHNEPNARLTAQLMYEFCHYNLAMVTPQTKARNINLPAKGEIDPNELFPRSVAEECWEKDKPCEDFMTKNAGATKGSMVEQYAQRQFFLSIKKCSEGFSLPVIALHNNTIEDTAQYRQAVKKTPLDTTPIQGKTFDPAVKAVKPPDMNTLPFAELQEWLLKNVPGVTKRAKPTGTKGKLESQGVGVLTPGKTNIFLWCSAEDIARCQIGDPERPDNVVWVTNEADFKKLQGTKANVVLQTSVDPKGKSATDLSSLFVFLKEIIDTKFAIDIIKLQIDMAMDAIAITKAIVALQALLVVGNAAPQAKGELDKIVKAFVNMLIRLETMRRTSGARDVKLSQLRFVNIETPQTAYDPKTKPGDLRVQGYRDVKETLKALGLACCDETPATGETESAEQKVEKALQQGALPKAETK